MPMSVNEVLAQTARRAPEAPALVWNDAPVSHREFQALIAAMARRLREAGVGPARAVGLAMPGGPLQLVAACAAASLGAWTVPLNPAFPPAMRARLVERHAIRHVACHDAALPVGAAERILVRGITPGRDADAPDAGDAEDPFCVMLTSGTTGDPKGVRLTHAHLQLRGEHGLAACDAGTRLIAPSMHVSVGVIYAIRVLCAGGMVVFPRTRALDDTVAAVRRHGATHLLQSPMTAHWLLEHFPEAGAGLPSLQHLRIVGGSPPPRLVEALHRRVTPNLFLNYALTEVGVVAIGAASALSPGSSGVMCPGMTAETVDESGMPLAAGTRGELRVRAPRMFPGYYPPEPAGARSRFRDGWFYTGDLGTLAANGELVVDGRNDEQLNLGGHKLMPGYFEEVLLRHAGVKDAAVFLLDGDDGMPRLAAAVVSFDGAPLPHLAAHCERELGAFAPQRYVLLPELPRNASGKLLRSELPAWAGRAQPRA